MMQLFVANVMRRVEIKELIQYLFRNKNVRNKLMEKTNVY